MANTSNFQLVTETRPDRKRRRKHGSRRREMELRSMSCPDDERDYSDKLPQHVRKSSSHGNRPGRSRGHWSYSEEQEREIDTKPGTNRPGSGKSNNDKGRSKQSPRNRSNKNSYHGNTDDYLGDIGNYGRSGHSRHTGSANRHSSSTSSNGITSDQYHSGGGAPRQNSRQSKNKRTNARPCKTASDGGGEDLQRHMSDKSRRSSSRTDTNSLPSSHGDPEGGSPRFDKPRACSSPHTRSPTSFSSAKFHQYPMHGELKLRQKINRKFSQLCSKRALALLLGFLVVVTLVLACMYFTGLFDPPKKAERHEKHIPHFTTTDPSLAYPQSTTTSASGPPANTIQDGGPSKSTSPVSRPKIIEPPRARGSMNIKTGRWLESGVWRASAPQDFLAEPAIDATTAIPEEVTSTNEPVVRVLGMDPISAGMAVKLECLVSNTGDSNITQITIQHAASMANITSTNPDEVPMQNCIKSTFQGANVELCTGHSANETSEGVIRVMLRFHVFTCNLSGLYTCHATSENGSTYSGDGYLNYEERPSSPHLTIPKDLVEGKEPTEPVTCSANLGFPQVHIEWYIKQKGQPDFMKFDGFASQLSGDCGQHISTSLYYTPTIEANGTLLKCVVRSSHFSPSVELAAVEEIRILPKDMCENVTDGRTLSHPFTCTKYITCDGGDYVIQECENNMCFDANEGVCGQKRLSLTSVVAYLNEGVTSLKCHLTHVGSWNNLTISKRLENGETYQVISVTRGVAEAYVHASVMQDRVYAHVDESKQYEVGVNMWIYVLACGDEGTYLCDTDPGLNLPSVTGTIQLLAKPDAPTLTIPNSIVGGTAPSHPFICEANVGYPHGQVLLKMRLRNETEFYPVEFNMTSEEEELNCSASIRKTFRFVPSLEHNGMQLRCEVSNAVTLPRGFNLMATRTVHVVPGNFCTVHTSDSPHVHPYDCQQYIQCTRSVTYVQTCGGKLCFNPDTQMCDTPLQEHTQQFDANRPCAPDKNGLYFAHPVLCNKFVWCVQGQEVVQHCPLGTLYLDGGQCTFEPGLSKCYQDNVLSIDTTALS